MNFGELVPTGGGDPIPLQKELLLIGRRDSCDISLRFPNVSSQHCQLKLINGYWQIRDLNSSNGTKVNGARIDTHWLMPGDELSVAKHHFEVKYTPTSSEPPPEIVDNMSMGLLEKAGLEQSRDRAAKARASQKRSGRPVVAPPSPPAPRELAAPPDSDDSLALMWLRDD